MERYFNTSGPCEPGLHYMLPPGRRLGRFLELVEQKRFFTLHAGRQTGKTTSALWVAGELERAGRFAPVWVDLLPAQGRGTPAEAIRTVLSQLRLAFESYLPRLAVPHHAALLADPATAVLNYLIVAARKSALPLVILFDEADGLVGEAMVSFLGQLRTGYIGRARTPFAASVALIGQRRVRDYALSREDRRDLKWLGTASPFNVEAESLTLPTFTREEVGELLGQHTQETGQVFEPAAIDVVFDLSQGQPWLVNALAYEAAFRDVKDRSQPITAEHIDTGRTRIVRERRTHLASLDARLREDRVRRVLAPMITGDSLRRPTWRMSNTWSGWDSCGARRRRESKSPTRSTETSFCGSFRGRNC